MSNRHQKDRLPPFVPLLKETLDAPAWKAMSHGARTLYVALKRRYSVKLHNNGRIFLSQRMAASELGSHHNEIARWFRELRHYGFLVQTSPGCLGVEGRGQAPRWRLTELGSMGDPPTREFFQWNGLPFRDQKTKSRAGKRARGVREMEHTTVPETAHAHSPDRASNGAQLATAGVPEKARKTSLPLSRRNPTVSPGTDWDTTALHDIPSERAPSTVAGGDVVLDVRHLFRGSAERKLGRP